MISGVDEPAFYLVQEALERLGRNRPLHARAPEASQQLGPIVGLSAAVVLDDERWSCIGARSAHTHGAVA